MLSDGAGPSIRARPNHSCGDRSKDAGTQTHARSLQTPPGAANQSAGPRAAEPKARAGLPRGALGGRHHSNGDAVAQPPRPPRKARRDQSCDMAVASLGGEETGLVVVGRLRLRRLVDGLMGLGWVEALGVLQMVLQRESHVCNPATVECRAWVA